MFNFKLHFSLFSIFFIYLSLISIKNGDNSLINIPRLQTLTYYSSARQISFVSLVRFLLPKDPSFQSLLP